MHSIQLIWNNIYFLIDKYSIIKKHAYDTQNILQLSSIMDVFTGIVIIIIWNILIKEYILGSKSKLIGFAHPCNRILAIQKFWFVIRINYWLTQSDTENSAHRRFQRKRIEKAWSKHFPLCSFFISCVINNVAWESVPHNQNVIWILHAFFYVYFI